MTTLVIPDSHQQSERLQTILTRYEAHVDRIIVLGDYFDSYAHNIADVQSMCKWLNVAAQHPKYTLLLGNHDLHYLYRGFRCSGYRIETQLEIDQRLSPETRAAFKTHAWIGEDILCSHAGLTLQWYDRKPGDMPLRVWLTRIDESFLGREWLGVTYNLARALVTGVGRSRGGYATEIGGLLWCDWNDEFEPIPGVKQIVGHTFTGRYAQDAYGDMRMRRAEPRHNGENWNIDTGLFHVALVTDGVVRIEEVE